MKSKADLVYDNLREAIVGGGLRPGERINMDELARMFGVSKIPIREAVKRLESEGLVVSRVHSGVSVAEIDRHEMRGVFLAREAIEGLVGQLAAENPGEELVTELDRIQARMGEALDAGEIDSLMGLNSEFHGALAAASGYRILTELTEQLLVAVRRYRIVAPVDDMNWRSVLAEHEAIIEAVRRGDPEAAAAAARAHTNSQADHEIATQDDTVGA
ncbi:GntR family transcriptional regulator [Streptomyces sp. S1]|uniref:GntR family transcriptional regulator n=1 Tax=Streptomyces sp. S1 TaxID=718288 RepID=UPI0013CF0771|nr:GntR family transcriptional regulator [Streptomyces sp. S1]